MLAVEARSESDSGLVLGIRHGTESGARVEVVAKQGAEASLDVRSESSSELELRRRCGFGTGALNQTRYGIQNDLELGSSMSCRISKRACCGISTRKPMQVIAMTAGLSPWSSEVQQATAESRSSRGVQLGGEIYEELKDGLGIEAGTGSIRAGTGSE